MILPLWLGNPDVFYFLLVAGILGIALEFLHPGIFIGAILGIGSLSLAILSGSTLPINAHGLALMTGSVGLLIAEIFVPSFGILGIMGLTGFVVGSTLLIGDGTLGSPSISLGTILPTALLIGIVFAAVGYLIIKSQKQTLATGSEALIGATGIAEDDFEGSEGMLRIAGELWAVRLETPAIVKRGDAILILSRRGLVLTASAKSY